MAEKRQMWLHWEDGLRPHPEIKSTFNVWDVRYSVSLPPTPGPGFWAYDYEKAAWQGPFQTYRESYVLAHPDYTEEDARALQRLAGPDTIWLEPGVTIGR